MSMFALRLVLELPPLLPVQNYISSLQCMSLSEPNPPVKFTIKLQTVCPSCITLGRTNKSAERDGPTLIGVNFG